MNNWIKFAIPAGLAILLTPLIVQGLSASTPSKIKVITYNVQFLPDIAAFASKRGNSVYRANQIVEKISEYDIIALQEMFDDDWRTHIVDGVRSAWDGEAYVTESPMKEGHFVSGGCVIISRFPIVDTDAIVYNNYSTVAKQGMNADGLAAKGVIYARLDLGKEKFVDVFVTHIEAAARKLRPLQYQEMAAFIQRKSRPDSPLLIMGDMNTNGNPPNWTDPNSQYSQLMSRLNAAVGGAVVDVWRELKDQAPGGTTEQDPSAMGNRIDYIFLRNGGSKSIQLNPKDVQIKVYQDSTIVALSDHNAVAVEFAISN